LTDPVRGADEQGVPVTGARTQHPCE